MLDMAVPPAPNLTPCQVPWTTRPAQPTFVTPGTPGQRAHGGIGGATGRMRGQLLKVVSLSLDDHPPQYLVFRTSDGGREEDDYRRRAGAQGIDDHYHCRRGGQGVGDEFRSSVLGFPVGLDIFIGIGRR